MADMFELKIIEPDGMFYEGQASFLEFASVMGEMGVYANHIPLTTILAPGVMKIHNDGQVKKAAVIGGFIEIQKKRITVMAEDAEWPEEIDVERAKAAKERAEKRLHDRTAETDVARAEAALKRAVARISATR